MQKLTPGCAEELFARRTAIIRTIASMQTHLLGLYNTGSLQCKLGYGNSMQCDIFQLGETVKFFSKLGLISLHSTMAGSDGTDPFQGDITKAIAVMRQCPSYQIDKHHGHCGLRDKMLPLLDLLESWLPFTGVCSSCWSENKSIVSWREATRPLMWSPSRSIVPRVGMVKHEDSPSKCLDYQVRVRNVFLANIVNWTNGSGTSLYLGHSGMEATSTRNILDHSRLHEEAAIEQHNQGRPGRDFRP